MVFPSISDSVSHDGFHLIIGVTPKLYVNISKTANSINGLSKIAIVKKPWQLYIANYLEASSVCVGK